MPEPRDRDYLETTWDGLPMAADRPHGAAIVVRRPGSHGGWDYLALHRAHRGPDYEGDWAWTPPSGARLPGEPVLAGAHRELAEEAGITSARLVPVDLSRPWAVFLAEVSRDVQVRLDAEHDKFTWLSVGRALRLCRPQRVSDAISAAHAVAVHDIAFRPLTRPDLPDLIGWQRAPHVSPWFTEQHDLASAERKYGPRIDGTAPVRVHVAVVGGQPCGFLQHYRYEDHPDDWAAVGRLAATGIDYAIGVAELTGIGLGPQLIWHYLRTEVLPAWPEIGFVAACPEYANSRSVRALEKAGFSRSRLLTGRTADRPELLCVLDRHRIFGMG